MQALRVNPCDRSHKPGVGRPQITRLRRPAVALSVLALVSALAPAGARAASRCAAEGSTTIAENRFARVYHSRIGNLSGCLKSTGRRLRLLTAEPMPYTYGSFALVALAGRHVAFSAEVTDESCKADCPPDYDPTSETVRVANLASRRIRAVAADPSELAVDPRGSVAWTQTTGPGADLHLSRSDGAHEVVAGGEIDLVGFSGAYLLWRDATGSRWLDTRA